MCCVVFDKTILNSNKTLPKGGNGVLLPFFLTMHTFLSPPSLTHVSFILNSVPWVNGIKGLDTVKEDFNNSKNEWAKNDNMFKTVPVMNLPIMNLPIMNSSVMNSSVMNSPVVNLPKDIIQLISTFLQPESVKKKTTQENHELVELNEIQENHKLGELVDHSLVDQELILDQLYDLYNSKNPFITDTDGQEILEQEILEQELEEKSFEQFMVMLMNLDDLSKQQIIKNLQNVIGMTSSNNETINEIFKKIITSCLGIVIIKEFKNHGYLYDQLDESNEPITKMITKKMDEFINRSKTQNDKNIILTEMFHFFKDKLMTPNKIYDNVNKNILIPESIKIHINEFVSKNEWIDNYLKTFLGIFSVKNQSNNQTLEMNAMITNFREKIPSIIYMLLWETQIRGPTIKIFGNQSEIIMAIVSAKNNKYLDLISNTIKMIQGSSYELCDNYAMTNYNPFFIDIK